MASWHTTANADLREIGTTVVIGSVHGSLRILTADQLSIEDADGQRVTAVVVERAGDKVILAIADGTILRMTLASELTSSRPQPAASFHEQSWLVVASERASSIALYDQKTLEEDVALSNEL